MSHVETLKFLASITDTGLFERLATAVLREADPLYKALIHTGVNTEGKTIKGPLDGITFLSGAAPPHMISVHHTTGDRDKLQKKWLHDPSTVRSRKSNALKSGPGDILKTIKIYNDERVRTPDLVGTLVLTITSDPPQDVIRDAEATARAAGIFIDFWSASRIAHYLDTDPNGQYLRKQFFGITQERLSKHLLYDLSKKSLDIFTVPDDPAAWVERNLDSDLRNISKPGVTIISAESGQGKTVACYKRLASHIENGGYGIILHHEILLQTYSIEQAFSKALTELCPALLDGSGTDALAMGSPKTPVIIVIEDINKSGKAPLLLEKIASWQNRNVDSLINGYWQIFCPVWPQFIASLNADVKKNINEKIIGCSSFSVDEGMNAVLKRHELSSKKITNLEAKKISVNLGNDPLLIALHDVNRESSPSEIIKNFIDNKLEQLTIDREEFIASEYLHSILILIVKMFDKRIMHPMWSDIEKFELSKAQMKMLRSIAHQGHILRLVGDVGSQSIVFRHDRVRDWLAATAIAQNLSTGELSDKFISEPYFSRVIGLSLNKNNIEPEIVKQIMAVNPLALFYSLQEFSVVKSETQKTIIACIEEWLKEEKTHSKANEYLLWECINNLAFTDSPYVLKLLKMFKDKTWSFYEAGFRNGDLSGGIELCRRISPGMNHPMHDQLIHYVISKNRPQVVKAINDLLTRDDLNFHHRSGILRLCGYIRDSDLSDSLQYAWKNEAASDRLQILDDYLWACAHCCGDSPSKLLDPIFNTWASLSGVSEEKGIPSDRDDFAAHEIRWAFQKYIPVDAIEYFIVQADREDLHWPITYLLHGIDHPSAVIYVVNYLAEQQREVEGTSSYSPFFSMVEDEWHRMQEKNGKPMSTESKNQLFDLWSNHGTDKHLREQSFRLWSSTHTENDILTMKPFENDEILHDLIVIQRIKRGDNNVLPFLIKMIKTAQNSRYWWQFTRTIWSDELTDLLDDELSKLSYKKSRVQVGFSYHNDWITSELIMRLPTSVAESMLIRHWERLQYSYRFIQTALYLATGKLIHLVSSVVADHPEPKSLFKHLSMHFGIKTKGHPGITHIKQLEALLPYLDYLGEMDFYSFSELCNEHCWFDFRKKYIDPRLLTSNLIHLEYLSKEKAIQSLDTMLKQNRQNWIDHWVDTFLKAGVSEERVINIVFDWVGSQKKINLDIINLALNVVLQIGNRNHYFELLDICSNVKNTYIEEFHNAYFLLRKRQLH